jgi:hypothetical protein
MLKMISIVQGLNIRLNYHYFWFFRKEFKYFNLRKITQDSTRSTLEQVGSAGFEPAASSAQGWHHTKLDNDPYPKIIFREHYSMG